jgi:O-Antigen ligase
MTYQGNIQRGTAWQLILSGLLVFGLIFVWPIQYTIALRNVILGFLLLLMVWGVWCNRAAGVRYYGDLVGVSGKALILLTCWIVFQAALISPFPEKAFQEITGQWLKGLACFMLGTLVVGTSAINRHHVRRPVWLWLVTLVLGLQVALTVVDGFYLYAQTGAFQLGVARLMGHKALASYVCNTLFAVLAADILGRIFYRKRLLPMPVVGVLGLIVVGLVCTWMIQARNGLIGLGSLLLSCLVIVWLERRAQAKAGKLALVLALIAGLFIAFAWGNYKTDPRWQKFEESAALGWQLNDSHAWIKPAVHPYPLMSNGEQVDISAYERAAWIKSGVILAMQHPLGLGYDRSSYGRARAMHFGPDAQEGVGDHSHSSLIDLAIGIGIPGLLLWMAFLIALMLAGWRAFSRTLNPEGLVLIFLVTGFFGRSLIDSNIRDHMLEQFMFLAAMLLAETRRTDYLDTSS